MFFDEQEYTNDFFITQFYIKEAKNNVLFNNLKYNLIIKFVENINLKPQFNYETFINIKSFNNLIFDKTSWKVNLIKEGVNLFTKEIIIPFTVKLAEDDCCNIYNGYSDLSFTIFKKQFTLKLLLLNQDLIGFSIIDLIKKQSYHSSSLDIGVKDWGDLPIISPTENSYFHANNFSEFYNYYKVKKYDYDVTFEKIRPNDDLNYDWIDNLANFFTQFKLFKNINYLNNLNETCQFLVCFDWNQDLYYPATLEEVISISPLGAFPTGRIRFNLVNGYGVSKFKDYVNSDVSLLNNVVPVRPLIRFFLNVDDFKNGFNLFELVSGRVLRFIPGLYDFLSDLGWVNCLLEIDNYYRTVRIFRLDVVYNKYSYNLPLDVSVAHDVVPNLGGFYGGSFKRIVDLVDDYDYDVDKIPNVMNDSIKYNNKNYIINFPGFEGNNFKFRDNIFGYNFYCSLPSKMSLILRDLTGVIDLTDYLDVNSDWLVCFNNFKLSIDNFEMSFYQRR